MSKTATADYRGFRFWVFDVCESILFAEMAAVAGETPAGERYPWLADLEHELRVHATVAADFAIPLQPCHSQRIRDAAEAGGVTELVLMIRCVLDWQ